MESRIRLGALLIIAGAAFSVWQSGLLLMALPLFFIAAALLTPGTTMPFRQGLYCGLVLTGFWLMFLTLTMPEAELAAFFAPLGLNLVESANPVTGTIKFNGTLSALRAITAALGLCFVLFPTLELVAKPGEFSRWLGSTLLLLITGAYAVVGIVSIATAGPSPVAIVALIGGLILSWSAIRGLEGSRVGWAFAASAALILTVLHFFGVPNIASAHGLAKPLAAVVPALSAGAAIFLLSNHEKYNIGA